MIRYLLVYDKVRFFNWAEPPEVQLWWLGLAARILKSHSVFRSGLSRFLTARVSLEVNGDHLTEIRSYRTFE